MAEYDVNKAKRAIKHKLKIEKRKRRFIVVYNTLPIAASIIMLFTVAFFALKEDRPISEVSGVATEAIKMGSNRAILTLDNGNQVVVAKGRSYKEGKVRITGDNILKPNQQSIINPQSDIIDIKDVDGTYPKKFPGLKIERLFSFTEESLWDIMTQLSR